MADETKLSNIRCARHYVWERQIETVNAMQRFMFAIKSHAYIVYAYAHRTCRHSTWRIAVIFLLFILRCIENCFVMSRWKSIFHRKSASPHERINLNGLNIDRCVCRMFFFVSRSTYFNIIFPLVHQFQCHGRLTAFNFRRIQVSACIIVIGDKMTGIFGIKIGIEWTGW